MTTIGTATVLVTPPASGAFRPESGLDLAALGIRTGGGVGGAIFGAASRAIAPVAIASAVIGIASATFGWGRDAVRHLGEVEALSAQTASAIESTGGAAGVTAEHVQDMANRLKNLTGTSDEAIQGGANLLLTFKNIRNEAGAGNDIFDQATASLVDMARAMGTNPQSAAIQLGKALNDPIAGMASLGRMGVQFSADQKAVIQSLVDSGDVMGAQKIILGELQSQFGGSGAAYVETFPGKVALLSEAWEDFGDAVFGAAIPALGAAASGLTSLLNSTLTPAAVAVGALITVATTGTVDGGLLAGLGLTADSGVVDFLLGARDAVIGALSGDGLGDLVTSTLVSVVGALPGLLTAILQPAAHFYVATYLPAFLGLVLAGIDWVATGFAPAVYAVLPMIVGALLTAATSAVPVVASTLSTLVPQLIGTIASLASVLLPAALQAFSALALGAVQAVLTLIPTLYSLAPGLVGALLDAYPLFLAAWLDIFLVWVDVELEVAMLLVSTLVVAILPGLATTVVGLLPDLVSAALGLFLGLVSGVVTVLPDVLLTIIGLLPSLITTLLGMLPTLLTTAVGLFFGLVTGLLAVLPRLITTLVGDVLPNLVTTLVGLVPVLSAAALTLFRSLGDAFVDSIPDVLAATGGVVSNLLAFVPHSPAERGPLSGSGWRAVRSGGQAIVDGFVGGIRSSAGQVGDATSSLADAAAGSLTGLLGIYSPSRLAQDRGEDAGGTFAEALAAFEWDSPEGDLATIPVRFIGDRDATTSERRADSWNVYPHPEYGLADSARSVISRQRARAA